MTKHELLLCIAFDHKQTVYSNQKTTRANNEYINTNIWTNIGPALCKQKIKILLTAFFHSKTKSVSLH